MQHGSECGRGRAEGGACLVGLLWAHGMWVRAGQTPDELGFGGKSVFDTLLLPFPWRGGSVVEVRGAVCEYP